MEKKDVPYQKTVFICTNARADGRTACANPGRGGEALCRALKDAVKAAGLKSKIRIARSGCLDRCSDGPNAFVYPEGAWYSGITEQDVPRLIESLAR